ncbi:MAG TPA: leucine-rich repeat domain-containing protein [Flavobacterium sp.]|nr:leucine-rich repeat domain-containing protein [Flavobacterium sp.]
MKKILLFLLLFAGMANAQIVNIPDANFKASLLDASPTVQLAKDFNDQWISIDANNDGEIQVSEAQAIKWLTISRPTVTNLTGLNSFSNLDLLNIRTNQVTVIDLNGLPTLTKLSFVNTMHMSTLNISNLTNLTEMYCYGLNSLTTLDVSHATNLSKLTCIYSSVNDLNITGLTNITELNLQGNYLPNLNVSGLTSLTKLNCSNNYIANLNVNNLSNLTELDCSYNQLLNLNGIPSNMSKLNCSYNKLTTLSINSLTNLTELDCSSNDIAVLNVNSLSNLTKLNCGANKLVSLNINGLPNLNNLGCNDSNELTSLTLSNLPNLHELMIIGTITTSHLTSLDLSGLPNLQKLFCSNGILTSLNLANLTSLTELDCSYNQITTLTLTNLPNLVKLNCATNLISDLDASNLTNLQELICANGYITNGILYGNLHNLNVAGLANLKLLICSYNLLSTLDLTGCNNIETLNCDGVPNGLGLLTSLNVNNLTNLKTLSCVFQQLTTLNVSNLTNLESLYVSYNHITNMDLTGLINLKNLDYTYNDLASLNLVNLPSLESLVCANNHLNTLNVLNLTNLKSLNCSFNELTTLNLSGLSSLETLEYSFNQLTLSNVSGLSTNLKSLACAGNNLTNLDVSGLTSLESLSCHTNELTSLDLSTLNNLKYLDFSQNHLPSIDVSNLTNLQSLNCTNNLLTNLNITGLNNITLLFCIGNALSSLDLTNHTALTHLDYSMNQLPDLDLSALTNLAVLGCVGTQTTTLDVSNMYNLQSLDCGNNQLTTLDLSHNNFLNNVNCYDNALTTLFIKNGHSEAINFSSNPTLQYICADASELESTQTLLNSLGMNATVSNSYCTFTPGGDYNSIKGIAIFDIDNNGCDVTDVVNPFVRFDINDGITSGATVTNINGSYNFFANAGNYTIAPNVENPTWFNFSPASADFTFLNNNNNISTQNFCIAAIGTHKDVEVVITPLDPARPGFDATYKIVYKNKGNQMLSGSLALTFDDSKTDLVSAFPTPDNTVTNSLSWNYINLMPFENRSITLTLNINTPLESPAVNVGDILTFVTSIPVSGDDVPTDNQFTYNQTVIGSMDPNAKTCLEGNVVSPSEIGNYLHYNIEFENIGNAEAVNIVVKDVIDPTMFDISTLQVMYSSHEMLAKIQGNTVEFVFQNINLAPAAGDPPVGGHGNVLFKIKTLPTLAAGDQVSNTANIYFDYNASIDTNEARTTFQSLGIPGNHIDESIVMYPNPAKHLVNINCNSMIKSVALYDIQGRILQTVLANSNEVQLNISDKSNGIYFVKVISDNGAKVEKLVKE